MDVKAHRRTRSTPMDETRTLHEDDFYSWAEQQAGLLRAGRLDLVDVDDLAEEIETLGRSEAAALRSSDRLIAMHLLKMIYRPAMATASWENTVDRERLNVETRLADNPGLKPRRDELFRDAYALARRDAAFEIKLDTGLFPPLRRSSEARRNLPASGRLGSR